MEIKTKSVITLTLDELKELAVQHLHWANKVSTNSDVEFVIINQPLWFEMPSNWSASRCPTAFSEQVRIEVVLNNHESFIATQSDILCTLWKQSEDIHIIKYRFAK